MEKAPWVVSEEDPGRPNPGVPTCGAVAPPEAWGSGRCVGHRTMRASSGKRTVQAPLRGRTAAVDTATSRRRGRLSRWLPSGRRLHGAKPLRSVG